MESVFITKIASRFRHVYQKTVWPKPKIGGRLVAHKETDNEALENYPYSVAWKIKKKDNILPVVTGHIPKGIITSDLFFFWERRNYGW